MKKLQPRSMPNRKLARNGFRPFIIAGRRQRERKLNASEYSSVKFPPFNTKFKPTSQIRVEAAAIPTPNLFLSR
jgi:hypothetical protein